MRTTGSDASTTAIEPWLAVPDAREALDFYRNAFGAVEAYRLDDDDGRPVTGDAAGHLDNPTGEGAAWNNLAIAYEQQGNFDKAREAYEKAVTLEPNNVLFRQNYDLFKEINDRAKRRNNR